MWNYGREVTKDPQFESRPSVTILLHSCSRIKKRGRKRPFLKNDLNYWKGSLYCSSFSKMDNFVINSIARKTNHSSVDSSSPSILQHQVRIPSTPSMLLSIYIWIISCGEDENKQKRGRDWPIYVKRPIALGDP